MLDNKIPRDGLRLEGFSINGAKHFRQEWYAFVRAHYPSIERAQARHKAAFIAKDKAALAVWSGRLHAWETELETIVRFEVLLEIGLTDTYSTALVFRNKNERAPNVDDALNKLGASHESIEDMILAIESEVDSKRINHHIPGTKEVNLRDDPVLGHLFTMPDHDRLRLGAMKFEEIKPFRATCTDEQWATILATITDTSVLEQITQALSETSPPDVDTGGG
jgi:hypothetical protein